MKIKTHLLFGMIFLNNCILKTEEKKVEDPLSKYSNICLDVDEQYKFQVKYLTGKIKLDSIVIDDISRNNVFTALFTYVDNEIRATTLANGDTSYSSKLTIVGNHISVTYDNIPSGDFYLTDFNTIDSLSTYGRGASDYSEKYYYGSNYIVIEKFLSNSISNGRDSIYVTDTSLVKFNRDNSGVEDTSFCYVEKSVCQCYGDQSKNQLESSKYVTGSRLDSILIFSNNSELSQIDRYYYRK